MQNRWRKSLCDLETWLKVVVDALPAATESQDMWEGLDHVGGTTSFLVPGDYARDNR